VAMKKINLTPKTFSVIAILCLSLSAQSLLAAPGDENKGTQPATTTQSKGGWFSGWTWKWPWTRDNSDPELEARKQNPDLAAATGMTFVRENIVEKNGDDLTVKAKNGLTHPFVGRIAELQQLSTSILSSEKGTVVYGDSGVGSEALIEDGLSEYLAGPDCPSRLVGSRLVKVDLNLLLATGGSQLRGVFEVKIQNLMLDAKDAAAKGETLILYLGDLSSITSGKVEGSEGAVKYIQAGIKSGAKVIFKADFKQKKEFLDDRKMDSFLNAIKVEPGQADLVLDALIANAEKDMKAGGPRVYTGALRAIRELVPTYMRDMGEAPGPEIDVYHAAYDLLLRHREQGSGELLDLKYEFERIQREIKSREADRQFLTRDDLDWKDNEEKIVDLRAKEKEIEQKLQKTIEVSKLMKQYYANDDQIRMLELSQQTGKGSKGAVLNAAEIAQIPNTIELLKQTNLTFKEKLSKLGITELKDLYLSEYHVRLYISKKKGLKIEKLTTSDQKMLADLEETFSKTVLGQDEATSTAAAMIRRGESGFRLSPNKPKGAMLVLGPTGAGKTFLGETMADVMFGSQKKFKPISCGSLTDPQTAKNLLIQWLTSYLRENPRSVVLLDEIEKMPPDVFNFLLEALDKGEITDLDGRLVSCREAYFLATSNVGQELLFIGSAARDLALELLDDEAKIKVGVKIDNIDEITRLVAEFQKKRVEAIQKMHQRLEVSSETVGVPKLPEMLADDSIFFDALRGYVNQMKTLALLNAETPSEADAESHRQKIADVESTLNQWRDNLLEQLPEVRAQLTQIHLGAKGKAITLAKQFFRKEVIERFSEEPVVYNFLSIQVLRQLVEVEVEKFKNSPEVKNYKLEIVLSDELKEFIAREGYNPESGARLLKRRVTALIIDPILSYSKNHPLERGMRVELDLPQELKVAVKADKRFALPQRALDELFTRSADARIAEVVAGELNEPIPLEDTQLSFVKRVAKEIRVIFDRDMKK